jgi:hypothetical protein
MNAYELADAIEDWEAGANYTISIKAGQMLRQQADRIAELEKLLQESAMRNISVTSQADEHYARVKELEKDLHMIQRHYDLLETFSPSGNNAGYVGNTNETLPKGKE